eukprot:TRINITY_DN18689_c0_g1_i3.p1 TRINITY_DN18689_c0_g1~~TRINITY_DN18689_c0_g1_i3.p1  ORF type:complete len:158 (-),score=20.44 TRINITY_DN18689_c0_g1_i3:186-659(-)
MLSSSLNPAAQAFVMPSGGAWDSAAGEVEDPPSPDSDGRLRDTLYIKNFAYGTSSQEAFELLSLHTPNIKTVDLALHQDSKWMMSAPSQKRMGAYVQYTNQQSAEQALQVLQSKAAELGLPAQYARVPKSRGKNRSRGSRMGMLYVSQPTRVRSGTV